jgi:hypothetical protein
MLSPGKFHLRVPRDAHENLRFRKFILARCRDDREMQAAILWACKQDFTFWVLCFVWQYNPRRSGKEVGPFIPYAFQDEGAVVILDHIGVRDLIIEKSRELGVSWWILIIYVWLCLFHQWKKFIAISHTEQAVDKTDDSDSLFWKIDFIHENLPSWMMHAIKRRLGITYTRTRSAITGQATTGRSTVGGRATDILLDEFGKQQAASEIWSNTADVGPRIIVSTHYGVGTKFNALCQSGAIDKLVWHWSMHPEKNQGLYRYDPQTNKVEVLDKTYEYPPAFKFVMDGSPTGGPFPHLRSPWYDAECIRRGSARDVAMHLDIDVQGSTSQFFDKLMIDNLKRDCCDPYWEGELSYDRDTGKPLALVPVAGGPLRLWLTPDAHGRIPAAPYGAGGDLSTGSGATPSCLAFFSALTGEKVAEYTNPFIDPIALAPLAVALCWFFADEEGQGAMLAWEMQGPGIKFGQRVIELGYRNVYFRTAEHALSQKVSDIPGWVPTPNNKLVVLTDYRAALSTRQCVNRSAPALDECLSFQYDGAGKVIHGSEKSDAVDPSGARENHGDHVVADALGWFMTKRRVRAPGKQQDGGYKMGSLGWRRELREERRKAEEAWA